MPVKGGCFLCRRNDAGWGATWGNNLTFEISHFTFGYVWDEKPFSERCSRRTSLCKSWRLPVPHSGTEHSWCATLEGNSFAANKFIVLSCSFCEFCAFCGQISLRQVNLLFGARVALKVCLVYDALRKMVCNKPFCKRGRTCPPFCELGGCCAWKTNLLRDYHPLALALTTPSQSVLGLLCVFCAFSRL